MTTVQRRMIYGTRKPGRPKKTTDRINKPLDEYSSDDVWHEGERIAANMLENRGLYVIDRNWRCPAGEADIVAMEDDTVVLVEVKSRIGKPEEGYYPEQAVNEEKIARYRLMLKYFMGKHPDVHNTRFDVMAVNLVADGLAKVRYIMNAATWDD